MGDGYIDLILPRLRAVALIRELAQLPIAVQRVTWWCHCTTESKAALGCPHGMGGPVNRFGEGWFSECVSYPDFAVEEDGVSLEDASTGARLLAEECSGVVCDYFERDLLLETFYTECLHPGLWLHVPESWRRRWYSLPGERTSG